MEVNPGVSRQQEPGERKQERRQERKPDPIPEHQVVRVSEIERLLARIPGVISARLMVNDWGAIEELHVLATTERGPKQIVRDVESTLAARWGIKIDHKKISVAQLAHADSAMPPVRLKVVGFTSSVDTIASRYQCTVALEVATEDAPRFVGRAEGMNVPSQYPRLVAEATVDALNRAVQDGYYFILEAARLTGMVGYETAVVLLTYHGPRGLFRALAGAAVVDGDPLEAVIRACLQATNRILERNVRRKAPSEALGFAPVEAAPASEAAAALAEAWDDGADPGEV